MGGGGGAVGREGAEGRGAREKGVQGREGARGEGPGARVVREGKERALGARGLEKGGRTCRVERGGEMVQKGRELVEGGAEGAVLHGSW